MLKKIGITVGNYYIWYIFHHFTAVLISRAVNVHFFWKIKVNCITSQKYWKIICILVPKKSKIIIIIIIRKNISDFVFESKVCKPDKNKKLFEKLGIPIIPTYITLGWREKKFLKQSISWFKRRRKIYAISSITFILIYYWSFGVFQGSSKVRIYIFLQTNFYMEKFRLK